MLLELVVALAGVSLIQGANFGLISSANTFDRPFKSESNGPLKCYVGILSIGGLNPTNVGAEVLCDGFCGSMSTTLGGNQFISFHCFPQSYCEGAGMVNKCSQTEKVTGCCCSTDNCNLNGTNIVGSLAVQPTEEAIVCYTGITTSGIIQPGSGWNVCRGECMTIKNGDGSDATVVYSCFPTSVSQTLGTVNNCQMVENGISACACTSDSCADPSIQQYRGDTLSCYVGVLCPAMTLNAGAQTACDGRCASLSGMVNGLKFTTFHCVPHQVCKTLLNGNTCAPLPGDRAITACCCNDRDNCNIYQQNVTDMIPDPPGAFDSEDSPISCWTGIYVNGVPVTATGFETCFGRCASITLNTTIGKTSTTATLYSCNPREVCTSLRMNNGCKALTPGTLGCCCDSDACIYPRRNRVPGAPLMCYVGLFAPGSGINAGGEMVCDGQCATLSSYVSGNKVTIFQCLSSNTCSALGLDNTCASLPMDRQYMVCCCDNSRSCNIAGYTKNITAHPLPISTRPISCWNGEYLNGQPVDKPRGFQVCNGQCASFTQEFIYIGNKESATSYFCSADDVCQALNITNRCSSPYPGATACCCNTDSCLYPDNNRSPSNYLRCHVGMNATGFSTGQEVICDGKCSSLTTVTATDTITTYQCSPTSVCQNLGLNNTCKALPGNSAGTTACCCDTADSCNYHGNPAEAINDHSNGPVLLV
ncbi:hypothetical protein Q1695_004538 [Nippostrongylus brasiliensis]|nr:hypothetical protein Q1695_004538 [Nippostrongylus brasiliensis]